MGADQGGARSLKILVVGKHDVTGGGKLRVEGFHRAKAVLVSPGDAPLIWTHAPLPNVLAGHINIRGHQHRALKSTDSPHINVSMSSSTTCPCPWCVSGGSLGPRFGRAA